MMIDTRAADEVEIRRELEWIGQDDAERISRRFTACLQDWMDGEGYDASFDDLRRRLRFLLEAIIRRERPQWRPIETAPGKRQSVLVLCNPQTFTSRGYWIAWKDENEDWFTTDGLPVYPTHWMPLPDPPEPEKGTP